MTLNAVARRYANALFDVVQKNGAVDQAEQQLLMFRDLVLRHDELRKLFDTPAVPLQKKRAVLEALLSRSGDLRPEIRRLLLLLADHDRLMLLPVVADAFAERAMQARRIVAAEVTTAVPLHDGQREALAQALGGAAGSNVRLTTKVDPSIVGGVIARVGSLVFDGSVTRQLEKMKEVISSSSGS